MAYDILNHLYGGQLIKPQENSKTPLIGQMLLFDQEAFINLPSSTVTNQHDVSEWIQANMALYSPEGWHWSTSGLFNLTIPTAAAFLERKSITKRSSLSGFDEQGFVYFPSSCANGRKCSIHVALHGCQQG